MQYKRRGRRDTKKKRKEEKVNEKLNLKFKKNNTFIQRNERSYKTRMKLHLCWMEESSKYSGLEWRNAHIGTWRSVQRKDHYK